MAKVLIAGCGYVGSALGTRLVEEGHIVWGLRRHVELLPTTIRPVAADLTMPETLRGLPPALEYIVYTAAGGATEDSAYRAIYVDGLRNLIEALDDQRQKPRRIIFTSSTAVFSQDAGEWVDEMSPAEPADFSGKRLLEGERLLLACPFAATVVRLAGIYGPSRTRLIETVRQGRAVCVAGPPVYTNRIHRDDCAGVLRHLMMLSRPEPLYLGVDHEPAEECEVFRWLARQLGVDPPRAESGSDRRTTRHQTNKRCRNARLLGSGYVFRYPTFREGYQALLAEMPS